jgi:hypothetical protein
MFPTNQASSPIKNLLEGLLWLQNKIIEQDDDARLDKEYEQVIAATGDTDTAQLVVIWAAIVGRDIGIKEEFIELTGPCIDKMLKDNFNKDEITKIISLTRETLFHKDFYELCLSFKEQTENTISARQILVEQIQQQKETFKTDALILKEELIKRKIIYHTNNEWQAFLSTSSSIKSAWSNDQEHWGKLCLTAVNLSLEKQFASAWELYQWLGQARYTIADILGQTRDAVFGRMRLNTFKGLTSDFATDISDYDANAAYYDQYTDCDRLLTAIEDNKELSNIKHYQFDFVCGQIDKTIDVITILDAETKTSLTKFYRTDYKNDSQIIRICHPPAIRCHTIFQHHIEPLYQRLLAAQDEEQKYYLLGKMAYYLAQLAPAEAGSAAISDMFIRRMMKLCHIPILPYTSKLNWDLEAIFSADVEAYASGYRQRFVQTPTNVNMIASTPQLNI